MEVYINCDLAGGTYNMTCLHCCVRLIASAKGDKAKIKSMAAFVERSIKTHKVGFTIDDVRKTYKTVTDQSQNKE